MSDRPLFVPLRAEWFQAFESGAKNTEWRAYGPRWNVETARPGRPVILSYGYSGRRLHGRVVQARRVPAQDAPEGARAIYPGAVDLCAIHIAIDGQTDS